MMMIMMTKNPEDIATEDLAISSVAKSSVAISSAHHDDGGDDHDDAHRFIFCGQKVTL